MIFDLLWGIFVIMAKLGVELVPATCWYSNVRTILPTKEWDRLRKLSYAEANYICEICSDSGINQGYRHALECHEIWEYNDKTKVQKLKGLISLCPKCHLVKHIGRANAMGYQAVVFEHMMKVNDWTHKQVVTHVAKAFDQFQERSLHEWKIDLNVLHEIYEVEKKLIVESTKKPRNTTPPKRKRRRK